MICVCAIAKNENFYINEWCKHYIKTLNFDKIYLYDNNDSTAEYVGNFIDEDIKNKVVIFNWQDKHYKNMQWQVYQDFYDNFGNKFDWVLYCDIDEFLTGITDIKQFLMDPKFIKFDQIRLKWHLFGDDNKIERDINTSIINSFTNIIDDNDELSNQGKSIVRGHLNNIKIKSCHFANYRDDSDLKTCLPSGIECKEKISFKIFEDYSKETIFLNHYMTKSLSEFLNSKYGRGDAIKDKREINLDYYWQINKKTKYKLDYIDNFFNNDQIDLVIPYVDSSDPNWIKVFNKYKDNVKKSEQTTDANRFRSEDIFFKYFFRCIDSNLSFIRNIYLLVMSISQVPDWIDKNKVKIILHEQFIPKRYLPTFNSGTIEMFIHNIPGLSENFIYANDDFYAISKLNKFDFFNLDYCKFNIQSCNINPKIAINSKEWLQMCQNNHDLIWGTKCNLPYQKLGHEFRPYKKSLYKNCYNLYRSQIINSISQFRETKNLTCYLFSLYLNKLGKRMDSNIINKTISTGSYSNINWIKRILENSDVVCINDTDESINIYENKYLNDWFNKAFPYPSKYEIDYNTQHQNKPRERVIVNQNKPKITVIPAKPTVKVKPKDITPFTGLSDEWWKEDLL